MRACALLFRVMQGWEVASLLCCHAASQPPQAAPLAERTTQPGSSACSRARMASRLHRSRAAATSPSSRRSTSRPTSSASG